MWDYIDPPQIHLHYQIKVSQKVTQEKFITHAHQHEYKIFILKLKNEYIQININIKILHIFKF